MTWSREQLLRTVIELRMHHMKNRLVEEAGMAYGFMGMLITKEDDD